MDATPAQIAVARCAVQADLVRGEVGPVFIKTHNAVAMVEGAPIVNFDITRAAIYAVRNPLDIAVSYAHFSGIGLDAAIARMADADAYLGSSERRVYQFLGSWSFHVACWLSIPHRPVLILRYEDMLSDPVRSFGRLAAFLRLRPSPEQLYRAVEMSSFEALAEQERRAGFVERPETAARFFRARPRRAVARNIERGSGEIHHCRARVDDDAFRLSGTGVLTGMRQMAKSTHR